MPQFKLALNNQWRQIFHDKDVLSSQEIKWNFTTALASWQGAFMRLVGMVKN